MILKPPLGALCRLFSVLGLTLGSFRVPLGSPWTTLVCLGIPWSSPWSARRHFVYFKQIGHPIPGKWISSTQPAHKKRPRRTHLRQPRLALYPSTVAQDPQLPAPLHSRRGLGWREFRQTPSKYSWHYQYYELSTANCLLPLTTSTARAQTANSISGGLSLWTSWRLRWRALHIASRSAFMELYRPRTYEDTLNNRQQKTQIHMLLR